MATAKGNLDATLLNLSVDSFELRLKPKMLHQSTLMMFSDEQALDFCNTWNLEFVQVRILSVTHDLGEEREKNHPVLCRNVANFSPMCGTARFDPTEDIPVDCNAKIFVSLRGGHPVLNPSSFEHVQSWLTLVITFP